MKYRILGNSGFKVSALGLGCMSMTAGVYADPDAEQGAATILRAFELGINFFDTADMYGRGENEILVGRFLAPLRDKIVLATKCGIVVDLNDSQKRSINNSPAYIKSCCDHSLKRLNTDYIDLFYLHRIADQGSYIEESMQVLKELIDVGKIRAIGLSEAAPDVIRRAHKIHPITALQSEYSL